jgi:thymidine kinase
MQRRGDRGWIEVCCGPMFSGKSEELIRRVTRSRLARIPVQTFKLEIDKRFADTQVVSHSEMSREAVPISGAQEILRLVEDTTVVVGVDEG